MKKIFIYAILLPLHSFAQRTIDVSKTDMPANAFFTVTGEPFSTAKYVRLTEGSPYFKDEWLPAVGTTANGIRYKAGNVKLDLLDGEIHFLDSLGTEMTSTAPLKQLLLTDSASGKNYLFVHASYLPVKPPKNGWYWQLASGRASLYCYPKKVLSESRPYGSAVSEQRIATGNEFYLMTQTFVRQVKAAKDVADLLPDKKPELEAWLKTRTGKEGLAEQLTSMITYYNSLHN